MAIAHDYDAAASHLGNKTGAKPKGVGGTKAKPLKEFHVRELHDGTYHVQMHHGMDHLGLPVKPHEERSAPDLDGVHDHLEEHMGMPNDGETGGEKKQGSEEAAPKKHEKAHAEDDEKAEHGKSDEGKEGGEKESEA